MIITAAVTAVLQLAVSMDYGIFLLHARARHLEAGADRKESLHGAIVDYEAYFGYQMGRIGHELGLDLRPEA